MAPSFTAFQGDSAVYMIEKNGVEKRVQVLERRPNEAYIHYIHNDKRLDEWVPEDRLHLISQDDPAVLAQAQESVLSVGRAVRLGPGVGLGDRGGSAGEEGEGAVLKSMTEEEYDIEHHKQITAKRNFDKVNFGRWQIKTWYFSPYPLTESEIDEQASTPGPSSSSASARIPGVARSTIRSHGRTSDLLAGGLGRSHGSGERSVFWVCEWCFKYMAEGVSYELHVRKCTRRHPPGRKVYQRGAHTIWEVDGAKEKLYCQNLSLFGKLFIDVKTLFFDCDNFMFYILTDADSQRDHVYGFFSKEKVTYDDYNLACIVVLPPYQKKGFGMLLIEFSYELSKRAGKLGTPERPLSDLGLRSYLTFWTATLIRFFRRLLTVLPVDVAKVITNGNSSVDSDSTRDSEEPSRKRRKSTKGWDGEVDPLLRTTALQSDETTLSSLRTLETTMNPDGSATTHVLVHCSLADIARATGLRVEDTAFTLNECGLLVRRKKVIVDEEGILRNPTEVNNDGDEEMSEVAPEDLIVISREMIESVAKERRIRPNMYMDRAHVLL